MREKRRNRIFFPHVDSVKNQLIRWLARSCLAKCFIYRDENFPSNELNFDLKLFFRCRQWTSSLPFWSRLFQFSFARKVRKIKSHLLLLYAVSSFFSSMKMLFFASTTAAYKPWYNEYKSLQRPTIHQLRLRVSQFKSTRMHCGHKQQSASIARGTFISLSWPEFNRKVLSMFWPILVMDKALEKYINLM